MEHEERSLRLVHRIEAFSDLVMGFSLALLALTLVIPLHALGLVVHPFWLVSYFWTFALIAFLWMRHQLLFSAYFVATRLCIVTNFVFLSMLGLIVYFVQVFGHVRGEFDQAVALVAYWAAFAVALMCLGIMYALGTRQRWEILSPDERFTGVSNATRSLVVGVTLLVGCIATPFLFLELRLSSTITVILAGIAGILVSRIWLYYQKPRITETTHVAA